MSITFEHTLKVGGKIYTFNIGGAGCEKRITRLPHIINKDPIHIYGFGQDSLGILKSETQLLLSLADGHGPKEDGKIISYKIHEYMLTYIADLEQFILSKIKEKDIESIKTIVTKMFEHVNNIILSEDEETSLFNKGGTTFTLVHKIIDEVDGSLYSLSYNVGDSPYFKISMDGKIEELSEEHNCDNIQSVEDYYNHCLDKGDYPSPIILGRFNHMNNFKIPWMGYSPINPYNIEMVDGKYKVSHNIDTMKQFYECAPICFKNNTLYNGGPQSIRGRENNIKSLAEGCYPMENYGSTINGDLQNINSFGDKQSIKEHNIMCKPHISINKISKSHYDFIGSDGTIDCLTNSVILEIFKEISVMKIDEFIKYVSSMVDTKGVEGGFKLTGITHVPTWDDNSFWVVETTICEEFSDMICGKSMEPISNSLIDKNLEETIIELEKQQLEMLELAKSIQKQIGIVNASIDKLV